MAAIAAWGGEGEGGLPIQLPLKRNPFGPCLLRPLGIRFDGEMRGHRWALIVPGKGESAALEGYRGAAVRIEVEDAESGERWEAVPERMGRSGGMFAVLSGTGALRFYAGMLRGEGDALEWQLITDDRKGGERHCHLQVTAPTGKARRLRVRATVGEPEGDAGGTGPAALLCGGKTMMRLDAAEPRDWRRIPGGFEFKAAATPATGNFPRSATFAWELRERQEGEGAEWWEGALEAMPLPEGDAVLWTYPTEERFWLAGEEEPGVVEAGVHLLETAAGAKDRGEGERLASAWVCAARGGDGAPAMTAAKAEDGRWKVRLGVNPDPDLPPDLSLGPNRATAILQEAVRRGAGTVVLDFRGTEGMDAGPAALRIADFPATWEDGGGGGVGVRLRDAAAEAAATLACALHREGIAVVVADDLENLPFTAHYADAVLWEDDEGLEAAAWAAGGRPVVDFDFRRENRSER